MLCPRLDGGTGGSGCGTRPGPRGRRGRLPAWRPGPRGPSASSLLSCRALSRPVLPGPRGSSEATCLPASAPSCRCPLGGRAFRAQSQDSAGAKAVPLTALRCPLASWCLAFPTAAQRSATGSEPLPADSSVVAVPIPASPSLRPYPESPRPCLLQSMDRKSLKPKLPHWIMGFAWRPKISLDSFAR